MRPIATVLVFGNAPPRAVDRPLACPPRNSTPARAAAMVFGGTGGSWIDLTHSFSESSTYWPTADGVPASTPWRTDRRTGGYFYSAFNFSAAEHGGTHLDAPIHFSAKRRLATDQIGLDQLIGPAVVVDVSDQDRGRRRFAGADYLDFRCRPGGLRSAARFEIPSDRCNPACCGPAGAPGTKTDKPTWEPICRGRRRYLNCISQVSTAQRRSGSSKSAIIAAIGIDTPSIDRGQSTTFEAHQALYGADIPGFENVAHLDALPPTGSYVVALPMKIQGGSGAPLRIVAFLPSGHLRDPGQPSREALRGSIRGRRGGQARELQLANISTLVLFAALAGWLASAFEWIAVPTSRVFLVAAVQCCSHRCGSEAGARCAVRTGSIHTGLVGGSGFATPSR